MEYYVIPTVMAGGFAGLSLGLSHWILPEKMHVVFSYAYGSFFCLTALTLLGLYLGVRWQFLLASWAIWMIAGVFVGAMHLKDFADESRKNKARLLSESGSRYERDDDNKPYQASN